MFGSCFRTLAVILVSDCFLFFSAFTANIRHCIVFASSDPPMKRILVFLVLFCFAFTANHTYGVIFCSSDPPMKRILVFLCLFCFAFTSNHMHGVIFCSSDPPVKRILLVTYGRSGSTFTSYILKEAPGAFFFFEPLRPELLRSTQGRNDVIMSYKALGY